MGRPRSIGAFGLSYLRDVGNGGGGMGRDKNVHQHWRGSEGERGAAFLAKLSNKMGAWWHGDENKETRAQRTARPIYGNSSCRDATGSRWLHVTTVNNPPSWLLPVRKRSEWRIDYGMGWGVPLLSPNSWRRPSLLTDDGTVFLNSKPETKHRGVDDGDEQ
ncbi:hypothetical protein BDK51DRAFT_30573 [Blyttiomyces helicus]|uniref:Uncharacterized protein n=1 Tax=Blyttiomyces helicus TaxID=388810 RepID=A0A4V1IQW5_9FUNG|nr:hypothetical protein BDK51DRAFT_30573 [Blyttiomyces helicus]|eukprot:RKO87977.1 hypothetical protein BDK51DRAFT_30573 [Blyttiomyces helicus]